MKDTTLKNAISMMATKDGKRWMNNENSLEGVDIVGHKKVAHPFWKGFTKAGSIAQVACVAVVDGGKILLGKRKDNGKWTTPGGHMEPGETPIQGALRELFEESGIRAKPEDLEHLATKRVTKPDGTKLVIHGFKLDQGKHRTSIKGDPDEEVHRWLWKPIPLPDDVASNLHVQKQNILLDALKIDYPQSEKTGSQLMDLVEQLPIFKTLNRLGMKKNGSFYDAVSNHLSQDEGTQPQPDEEKTKPHEKTEHSGDDVPNEVKTANHRRRIHEFYLSRHQGDVKQLANQFAQIMSQRTTEQPMRGDEV